MKRIIREKDGNALELYPEQSHLPTSKQDLRSIGFLRISGLVLIGAGIASLVSALLMYPAREQVGFLYQLLLGCILIFSGWVFYLYLLVPLYQSTHLVVCEYGLFQMKGILRKRYVAIIHWKDILAVRKQFIDRGLIIHHRGGEAFVLSSDYYHLDELVALIKERGGTVDHVRLLP